MATRFHQPMLVNKQFNSPIKLYSQDNVREILDKETKVLANGAVGIDFHQLAKPANLRNSAVLRMLEEEEHRQRNGQPKGYCHRVKRICVSWPPEPENDYKIRKQRWVSSLFTGGQHQGLKQVVWPPPHEVEFITNGENLDHSQNSPQSPQPQHTPTSPHSPQPFHQQQQQGKGWAPVSSPLPKYQPQPTQAFRPVEPPPSTIQLRPSPPIRQAPPPVYCTHPVTAALQGGTNMRGDQKWPPASVKAQTEQENEQRQLLAKGPAFRPRKVQKDYSSFFAQHALNATYPGYRAPPGTQHYQDQPGVSNY